MSLRGHLDPRGKTASHMLGHLAGVCFPAARSLRPPGHNQFSSQMMEMLLFHKVLLFPATSGVRKKL